MEGDFGERLRALLRFLLTLQFSALPHRGFTISRRRGLAGRPGLCVVYHGLLSPATTFAGPTSRTDGPWHDGTPRRLSGPRGKASRKTTEVAVAERDRGRLYFRYGAGVLNQVKVSDYIRDPKDELHLMRRTRNLLRRLEKQRR